MNMPPKTRIAALRDAHRRKWAALDEDTFQSWVSETPIGHALGPVSTLMESVGYHRRQDHWRCLRCPISLSEQPHWYETFMVQVGAKRIRASKSPLAIRSQTSSGSAGCTARARELPTIEPPAITLHGRPVHILRQEANASADKLGALLHGKHEPSDALKLLNELVKIAERFNQCQKRVAAAVLNPEGLITRISLNYPWLSHVWHAEWLLIRGEVEDGHVPSDAAAKGTFAQQILTDQHPSSQRILTTLKPCRMCAALITRMSFLRGHLPQVYYSTFDPGRQARQTLLDAHSPDRTFCVHHHGQTSETESMDSRHKAECSLEGQWEWQIN